MKPVIGVDPGLSGALAVVDPNGSVLLLADLPVIRDKSLAWIDGTGLQTLALTARGEGASTAYVERVSSMPGQGVASSFTFGVGFGSLLSVLQALHIRIELVAPATWKRSLGLDRDKRASLDKARLLFPAADLDLAKHHGRAEALLLAHYGLRRSTGAAA